MQKTDLHGMHPAIVTPFSAGGEIMEDAFVEMVAYLIDIGASGICVAGDNGESWALSASERGRLVALAKATSTGRIPITCGCSAPTVDAALGYARAAHENGADALLSMPPTYVLKGSRTEIIQRYELLSREIELPIIVYNSPRRHGYSMTLDDLEAIMGVSDVIGIKESNRDFFHHTHLLKNYADKISVMSGPCHYIVPSYPLGASGFIATGPEFLGKEAARIGALAMAGPSEEARSIHYRLTVLYQMLMGSGTWPAAFKAALNLIGLPAGVPRDPVLPLDPQGIDEIKRTFDTLSVSYAS